MALSVLRKPSRRYVVTQSSDPYWRLYEKHFALVWGAKDLDLTKDVSDFEKLKEEEKFFIKHVLAFFATSDGIVNENLAMRFLQEVENPSAKVFYAFQMAMENVHSETYSLLIDTYVMDTEEKEKLFDAIETMPGVKRKADWALEWINNKEKSFAERLVAFAAVEGIFFSGSFCAIFWLKSKGLMPGLCASNSYIARDEGLHTDFACLVFKNLDEDEKADKETVKSIIMDAVDAEKVFITESLPVKLLGMNADEMSKYIEFCADRLIYDLGFPKIYGTANPFSFMEMISCETKGNFFENRVTEYSKASSFGGNDNFVFRTDADF